MQKSRGSAAGITKLRGVTLIEVMIAATILVLAASFMLKGYLSGISLGEFAQEEASLQAQARNALTAMVMELKNATRSGYPAAPGIFIPATPNNTRIRFYLPNDLDGNGLLTDASGALEWGMAFPLQYQYVSNDRTLIRVENGVPRVLVSNVQDVRFIDISIDPALTGNEVKMILTLSKTTARQRQVTFTLSGIVRLRN